MAISLKDYLENATDRDKQYAEQDILRRNQEGENIDFLDQVGKLRQSTLGGCNALKLDI